MLLDDSWTGSIERWWFRRTFDCSKMACGGFQGLIAGTTETDKAFVKDSYPPNHTYVIEDTRLVPNAKLAERLFEYRKHYPEGMASFLDLSCSKGFFVFDAAARASCKRAMGIDIDKQCLDVSRRIAQFRESSSGTRFEEMTLPMLAESIDQVGGSFQTALLMNTYQYLFFGSSFGPGVSDDHNVLFGMIRKVCHGRVLFHNRASVDRMQRTLFNNVDGERYRDTYTPKTIREAAEKYFTVTVLNSDEDHPFWRLDAK